MPTPILSFSLVLYMLYYPPNLKYIQLDIDTHDARPIYHVRTKLKSSEWRLSIIVSWIVFLHLYVSLYPFPCTAHVRLHNTG